MNRLDKVFKSKMVLFAIQIALLSLFIFIFNYKSVIIFDSDISEERQVIIQFLANYIIFTLENNGITGFIFISLSWTLVSIIPILIFNNFKKAWTMNLTTFFFPNFFFYVFYARYSRSNFDLIFPTIFGQTILLALYIIGLSIGISLGLAKLRKSKEDVKIEDLREIEIKAKSKCPYCGTEFESIPKYCYNCSKEITSNKIEKS